jgi:pectinesterase
MTAPVWNPCASGTAPAVGATYGTSGSATMAIYARDFHAKNLTISNDFDEAGGSSSVQAVALMTQNDKLIFENVRMLGNQDTLYVKTGNVDTVQRAYFKACTVEGDVDFIFGRATFVLDGCTIRQVSNRRTTGNVISPSTDARNGYGLLIINSMIVADAGVSANGIALGRAWDEGFGSMTYPAATGIYPNGQAVIRQSVLDAKVNAATPWSAAATTSRAYTSTPMGTLPANRLWEFANTGPGAAP